MSMNLVSVVCRSGGPTVEFPAVSGRTEGVVFDRPCDGGWWWGAYTDTAGLVRNLQWLAKLEEVTGAPALLATDLDSDCVDVLGRTANGGRWRACLVREEMQSYLDEDDVTVQEMFLEPYAATEQAASWAVRAGLVADRDRLGYLFRLEEPDDTIGDLTEELLIGLGLHPQ